MGIAVGITAHAVGTVTLPAPPPVTDDDDDAPPQEECEVMRP